MRLAAEKLDSMDGREVDGPSVRSRGRARQGESRAWEVWAGKADGYHAVPRLALGSPS